MESVNFSLDKIFIFKNLVLCFSFDKNGRGYLELKEINSFLVELVDYLNTEDSSDVI
jgi:hypothetical protein